MPRGATKVTPSRMIGNIYFVGTVEASSHIIDTGDGLIMIDTGYVETPAVIAESMKELGFDFKDLKIILHSHGHYDHTEGTEQILKLAPEAKTYLSFKDIRYIKGFTPDFDIKDGDVIELGNTKIECWFTPGHTEGSVSFFMDVEEDGKIYRAAMFGGSGFKQLKKDFMTNWRVPYLCRGLFFDSIERLLTRKVDVMIGNHTWQNHTVEKLERMKDSAINPFIDPTEWEKYLKGLYSSLKQAMIDDSRDKFIKYSAFKGNCDKDFDEAKACGFNGICVSIRKNGEGLVAVGKDGEVPFEEFLKGFSNKDLALSVELKEDGIEKPALDLIYNYGVDKTTMVVADSVPRLKAVKEHSPYIHSGYKADEVDDEKIELLKEAWVDELLLKASGITPEKVKKYHRIGFDVCAFGERKVPAEELGIDAEIVD